MKKKIKEFAKSYLVGLILGIIISGTISVIAATYFPSNDVTYDNSTSGLQSTNVQGAIDELYTVCTYEPPIGEQIIENAGLEKDPYECRYFFTGANPNNYITFNGEEAGWRIISVECDGTIKIIRRKSIGSQYWYMSSNINWAEATLNTYLNNTYLYNLSSEVQGQIQAHDFGIGAVKAENNDLSGQINDENSSIWNGKIALPTASEYIRTNSNKNNCGTMYLVNNNYSSCNGTNWMDDDNTENSWWTLSPYAYASRVFNVSNRGYFSYKTSGYYPTDEVRPTLYLLSNINLTGGNGTENNPYTIE